MCLGYYIQQSFNAYFRLQFDLPSGAKIENISVNSLYNKLGPNPNVRKAQAYTQTHIV